MYKQSRPTYTPQMGSDRKWFCSGPGEGLTYDGGRLYPNLRCETRTTAVQACETAYFAFDFGRKQFRLQIQMAIGLDIEESSLVKSDFLYTACQNDTWWYVQSNCGKQLYNQIRFATEPEAKVASRVCQRAFEAGYGIARQDVCKLINAKCNGE